MEHNLFVPGTKFEVVEPNEDNTYGVGSTGFLTGPITLDSSFMNLATCSAIFVRRGKGGKDRINYNKFYTPVFAIDDENFLKVMPSKGMRKPLLNIKKVSPLPFNVMEASNIDFLGWAVSCVTHLLCMSKQCKHSRWPENKSHMLNRIHRAVEYFEEDTEKWFESFTTPEARTEFLGLIRPAFASMVRMGLQFDKTRIEAVAFAAEFLNFVNSGEFIPKDAEDKKNEYRFTEDDKALAENIKQYKSMLEVVEKLMKAKQKKS